MRLVVWLESSANLVTPPHVLPSPEPKAVEEMKGTDQEYSSALAQYNSSANSGGEDIELLAFQTVTGKRPCRHISRSACSL